MPGQRDDDSAPAIQRRTALRNLAATNSRRLAGFFPLARAVLDKGMSRIENCTRSEITRSGAIFAVEKSHPIRTALS